MIWNTRGSRAAPLSREGLSEEVILEAGCEELGEEYFRRRKLKVEKWGRNSKKCPAAESGKLKECEQPSAKHLHHIRGEEGW